MRAARNVRLFPGKYASDCVFTASTRPHAHLRSLKGTPQNWPGRRCAFDFERVLRQGHASPYLGAEDSIGCSAPDSVSSDRHADSTIYALTLECSSQCVMIA